MVQKIINSTRFAMQGLLTTFRSELSFRLEVVLGVFLILFALIFWPLRETELFAIIIAYGMVLIAELLNTSIERAFQRMHPEQHELVGISKDAAAASVFVALIVLGIVLLVILVAPYSLW